MNTLLTTPPLNVYEQMALDETLARSRAGEIILRLYRWTGGPAVTFGYAQFVREVRRGIDTSFKGSICRRPTGGGVVYHTEDLTFSLIFPSQERPSTIYAQLHQSIRTALTTHGITAYAFTQKVPAAAYAPSQHHTANACFVNPVENDLLLQTGQKMLGGAIRRFGSTILYQGSLQLPGARENPACKQAVIEGVRQFLGVALQVQPVDESALAAARTQADTQYQTPAWTEKF